MEDMTTTSRFDLVVEPWIYCRTKSGVTDLLSLRDIFSQAHEILEITDNNPLTVAALYRLLLAIIHRAVDGPATFPAWEALWQKQSFLNSPILEYLETQRANFDLFAEQNPFYQTASFTLETTTTSQKLLHELATGNNKTLFDHHLDTPPAALLPDHAARALVTAQMYSFGGGQGATSNCFDKHPNFAHAPLVFGALILVQGANLFETLLLNLLFYDKKQEPMFFRPGDAPVWERGNSRKPGERDMDGYLDYLTWRSRHIRLLPEEENGQIVVRHLYMAQGDVLFKKLHEHIPGDPMFAYGTDKEGKRYPLRMDAEKSFWRNSAPLFEFSADKTRDGRVKAFKQAASLKNKGMLPKGHLRCLVIGIANDKANPLCWRMEQLTVPSEILQNPDMVQRLKQAVGWAENIGEILHGQIRSLAQYVLAPDGRKADAKTVSRLAKSLGTEAQYWARLEAPFRKFLANLTEAELNAWYRLVKTIAIQVLEETTRHYLSHTAREIQAQTQATGWLGLQLGKAYKALALDDKTDETEAVEELEDY